MYDILETNNKINTKEIKIKNKNNRNYILFNRFEKHLVNHKKVKSQK